MKYKQDDEGMKAFNDGKGLQDCPYPMGTTESVFWKQAWLKAREAKCHE